MKKLFLFIAFVFAFTVSNAMVDNGNDTSISVFVDVGYTADVVIAPAIYVDIPLERDMIINDIYVLKILEADYQYISYVYDTGIGKKMKNQNILLKSKLSDANKRIIRLENTITKLRYQISSNENIGLKWRSPRDAL